MSDARIIDRDGLNVVECDHQAFGLGLQMPEQKPLTFEPLENAVPLLSWKKIRSIVTSDDFEFGGDLFDSSWLTNQNGYGSCAGYAAASALSKARVISGQPRVDLSGDYQYSRVNGGRDRGSMLDDNMHSLMDHGCATKALVPLGGIYPSKYNTAKAKAEAQRFKASDCYAVTGEQSLATALALRMPVVIAIHVGRNWRREDSRDVLIGDDGPGNHSEHLDDIRWNGSASRFEYRDASSHNRPYFWVHWGHLKTPSRYHMFYAVPNGIKDPEGQISFL